MDTIELNRKADDYRASDEKIGRLFSDQGVISETDLARILEYAKKKNLRFGDAAIKLKKIRRGDLDRALATQFKYSYVPEQGGRFSRELITAYRPFSKRAETFRTLRSELVLGRFTESRNMLAIASPSGGEGKSYVAANLAVVFSQMGHTTLLIDAHLQKPRQHEIFGIDSSPGLAPVLAGRTNDCMLTVKIPELDNLTVFPAGARPPNSDELVAGDEFERMCRKMQAEYDIVLMDTPAGDESTAVDWIATRCGEVLVVLRRDHTRLADAQRFTDRMRARAATVDTVLNTF